MKKLFRFFAIALAPFSAAVADVNLDTFDYPHQVERYAFNSQQTELEMAYMDYPASESQIGTVVLLHGKNFSGAYFQQTAESLSSAGFRVITPDQIGFGKSTKPLHYQFSFAQLAGNTVSLLESLGVDQFHLLGHSMGGMLASRMSLMYPDRVASLTLLNPIGLEDWAKKGVPYTTVDGWYQSELNKSAAKIRKYQLESYYDGKWKPEYDAGVEMLSNFISSPDYPRMAWVQALAYDMIFTQPVIHEFENIQVPTLLIIGQRDRTALGKNLVSKEVKASLGNYVALGENAHRLIPDSKLIELVGIGHLPHIESFPEFIAGFTSFIGDNPK